MIAAEHLALIAWYLVGANLLALAAMGWDKVCSVRNRWRVPEARLLFFATIGGAFGAKLAQSVFRHKTRKQPFARKLNISLVFNLLVFATIAYVMVYGTEDARRLYVAFVETVWRG